MLLAPSVIALCMVVQCSCMSFWRSVGSVVWASLLIWSFICVMSACIFATWASTSEGAGAVCGAGLAGCEAAWQLVRRGIPVRLVDMKPENPAPGQEVTVTWYWHCKRAPQPGWGQFVWRLLLAVGLMLAVLLALLQWMPDWHSGGMFERLLRLGVLVLAGALSYFAALGLLGFRLRDFSRRAVQ